MMNDGSAMFFGGGFMWIFWAFILALFIWGVISIVLQNPNSKRFTDDTPLDIVKKLYARGEIDEQEYMRRRKELDD